MVATVTMPKMAAERRLRPGQAQRYDEMAGYKEEEEERYFRDLVKKYLEFIGFPIELYVEESREKEIETSATKAEAKMMSSAADQRQMTEDEISSTKKAVDGMIAQLPKEKSDEIKHKGFCVDEFNMN